jgi:LPS-assembly protein
MLFSCQSQPFCRLLDSFSLVLLFSSSAIAQENSINVKPIQVCPLPVYNKIFSSTKDYQGEGVFISSKHTFIDKNALARFSGDVTFSNGGQSIHTELLEYNQKKASFTAAGKIHFQSQALDIFAEELSSSKEKESTSLYNSSYQFANNPGHGSAKEIRVHNDGILNLLDSSFTTCYGETPDWQLTASEINISAEENFGEAYHAKFELLGVPILYLPYLNFPVTNKRKSGFLYPRFKSSSKLGTQIETPFYWNITSNVDATITPRYISNRGSQLLTELRYLTGEQSGVFDIEYLQNDKKSDVDNERYLARFQHSGTFSNNFRAYIDTTITSDDNYLADIGSNHYQSNDAYLYQVGELSYFSNTWSVTGKVQDFEIIGNHLSSYKTLPQIEFNSNTPLNFLNANFNVYSELTKFDNADKSLPIADRYHVEAGLTLPISTPGWYLNSEVKILQTHYKQTNLENDSDLEQKIDRTLPKVRIHGGLNLDRVFNNSGYTQTLEPQLQYLYIPEKDQSAIGIYDSAPLRENYQSLFRDRRFSGLDRIAGANQYSWGVTTRILNQMNDEIFRLSLGRIIYLSDNAIDFNSQQDIASDQSALAAETFFQINDKWQLDANIQYNTESNKTNNSQMNLYFQEGNKYGGQLNHRYIKDVSGIRIEQLSLRGKLAISQDWQIVASLTQDIQNKRSIESYAGLQYESCCWALRFSYHRHIDSNPNQNTIENENLGEFDSGFMLQFVIKGLSGGNSSLATDEMLNESIFGYKRPYFLNN